MKSLLGSKQFLFGLGLICCLPSSLAADPLVLDPRHTVEKVRNLANPDFNQSRITGMAFGPGGDFGTDLYAVDRTRIRIINLSGGSITTFVTISPDPGFGVNLRGIAFGKGGAFGNDMYILNSLKPSVDSQPKVEIGRVLRIDKDKNVTVFSEVIKVDPNPTGVPDGTADFNDLVFGPGIGGFSSNLFLTDGAFGGGGVADVYQVDSAGSPSLFHIGPDTRAAIGLDFASGGGFGAASLIVTSIQGGNDDNGIVGELKSDSSLRIISRAQDPGNELWDPCAVRQGPGGEFGDDLFVTDLHTDKIYKLNAYGILSPFAQGFLFDQSNGHRLLFTPDKKTLLVSDGSPDGAGGEGVLWRIVPLDRQISAAQDLDETFELTPERRSVIYKVTSTAPPGDPLILNLDDLDAVPGADANALYFRWGSAPTVSEFDHAAEARGRDSQAIVVPITRDQPFYIMAVANVIDGGSTRLRLHAKLEPLALEKTNISLHGEVGAGLLNVTVFGAGFSAGFGPPIQFRLQPSTAVDGCAVLPDGGCTDIPAEVDSVKVVSAGRAEMAFDLSAACPGFYNLVVTRGTLTASLGCVFQVLPGARGAELSVRSTGFQFYRCYGVGRFTIEYSNIGDLEMTAPLLKVVPPPGIELRLEGEDVFRAGEVQLLAGSSNGAAGKLPPGAAGRVGIVFRTSGGACLEGDGKFQVLRFHPGAGDVLDWELVERPPGIPPAAWPAVRAELTGILGDTWMAYQEKLAEIATRLSYRGVFAPSVRGLFQFAVRQAYGRPSSAILGKLLQKDSRIPLVSQQVVAMEGPTVVSSAVTDPEGSFVLDWLEGGTTYTIEAVGYDVGRPSIPVPAGGDAFIAPLEAVSPGSAPLPACPGCDTSGLPDDPPLLPAGLCTAEGVPQKSITVINSFDPNKKEGPAGQGDGDGDLEVDDDGTPLVGPTKEILYKIIFENKPTATGYAGFVQIRDKLSEQLDPTSVRFVDFQIGTSVEQGKVLDTVWTTGEILSAKPRSTDEQSFGADSTIPVTVKDPVGGLPRPLTVSYHGDMDTNKKVLIWTFNTSNLGDSSLGFLPMNDREPKNLGFKQGEGYITIAARPFVNLAEGETITNEAFIKFDSNPEEGTGSEEFPNPVVRFYKMPEAAREGTAESAPNATLKLSWKSRRASTYDLFLWEDRGKDRVDLVLEKHGLTVPTYSWPGGFVLGRRYLWQVNSKNQYNNVQGAEGPRWVFQMAQRDFRRGDVNGDGGIDLSDVISVLFYLFTVETTVRCEKAMDVNDDAALNVADPIYLLDYLFRNGDPPPPPMGSCDVDPTADDDHLLCRDNSGCP